MGLLHLLERNIEGARNRVLDQAFSQANPKIAGENLDQVLRFERGQFFEPMAKPIRFPRRPADEMQLLEKLIRFD